MGRCSARAQRRPPTHWQAPPPPGVRLATPIAYRLAPPIAYGRARPTAYLRAPIDYGRAGATAHAPPIVYTCTCLVAGDLGAGIGNSRRRPDRRGQAYTPAPWHGREAPGQQGQRPHPLRAADPAAAAGDPHDAAPGAHYRAADDQGKLAPAGSDATRDATPRADTLYADTTRDAAPRADTHAAPRAGECAAARRRGSNDWWRIDYAYSGQSSMLHP